MKTEKLATIVPHIFGHHEQCSSTWCTYVKDPTKFRFKHLPNGKALSGDKLREELDKLAQSYIERADRLLNLGSTQSNESLNNSVASFAQKTGMIRFYGWTKSLKARVSSAVMQKNEGYGWLSKRESVKEGDTYGGEIEVQEHIDTETIPSKMKLEGEESVVVFDLETTGLSRKSDLTQLAAFDGTTVFNEYVSPREVISPKSSEITGLTFDFSCDQMYHHGKPVKSRDKKDVFPFSSALLIDSYIPLIRASHITKLTGRRLAHSVLCLKHLQLAFNRDSENGLTSILLEHGFNAKTVTSFTKYFTCTEE
ncbi:uncharacterized protein LOC134722883 [Mytilus trossulus]|uniref:uncharacterized protein LOC134722883 n=1 Tax=Mytilus trossulus TaxID=6551 RepID=UPI003005B7B7